jgi:hypothetical protein
MTLRHTPGPWKVAPSRDGQRWAVLMDDKYNGIVIDTVAGLNEADARLIAAAPSMLAQVQNLATIYQLLTEAPRAWDILRELLPPRTSLEGELTHVRALLREIYQQTDGAN